MGNRDDVLNDSEFWTPLDYTASRSIHTSNDEKLRRFFVDGFTPTNATNTKRGLDVEGVAWVMGGSEKCEYHFIVSLPQKLLHKPIQNFQIESLSIDEDEGLLVAPEAKGEKPLKTVS